MTGQYTDFFFPEYGVRYVAVNDSGRNIAAKLNAEGVDTPTEYYFKQTGKRATRGDNGQQWGSIAIMQL